MELPNAEPNADIIVEVSFCELSEDYFSHFA